MGNCHYVVQIEPYYTRQGAALRVREADELLAIARATKLPRYVRIERCPPRFTIGNPNTYETKFVDEERAVLYVVIAGGGKWGYGFELDTFCEAIAPFVEDARFVINDETEQFVDEYRFASGAFTQRRIGTGMDSSVYVEPIVDVFAWEMGECDLWFERREPEGALRSIDRAIAARPAEWRPHYLRARALGSLDGHAEAIASLETARACLGPIDLERDPLRVQVSALREIDTALADRYASLGQSDTALATYNRANTYLCPDAGPEPLIGKAKTLATLGRADESDKCLVEAMKFVNTPVDVARILYERAANALRRGDRDRAVIVLAIAFQLDYDLRSRAHNDEEFATLRDHPELRFA